MSTTVTFQATQDTYTNQAKEGTTYGNILKLAVRANASNVQRTYIGFSLKALPANAIIKEAKLRLHVRGSGWTGNNTITVTRIITGWAEKTLNWRLVANQNKADITTTNQATLAIDDAPAASEHDVIVTDMVTNAAAGQAFHGFRITVNTNGEKLFHSSEQSTVQYRPQLIISYTLPPDAPSNLRPRGGHAVASASPKLAWDSQELAFSWVQVSTSDVDFVADLVYDSDWEANTEPFWDLALASTPDFPGVSAGQTRYWRVKIKTEDGDASPYSDIQEFERRTYGDLTITEPAADNDPVQSTTPLIETTFTGQTQTRRAWQLYRYSPALGDIGYERVLTQAAENTDETDFEIPKGGISDPDATYKLIVDVYDQYDRSTAVGESSFVEEIRYFTYGPTDPVDPVEDLDVTQPTRRGPVVSVTWTRATAPDTFDIYIDSDLAVQGLDAEDAFVGGTSYQWDLYGSAPRVEHNYQVVATEDLVDSTDNPVFVYEPSVQGIWLLAPDDELQLPIWGDDGASVVLGENSTTFELLNRPSPVRLTDSIRGWEGSVSGALITLDDITGTEAYRTLMRMKKLPPGTNFRLCLGPKNFPILLQEVSIAPQPDSDDHWECSISFAQCGEFDILE